MIAGQGSWERLGNGPTSTLKVPLAKQVWTFMEPSSAQGLLQLEPAVKYFRSKCPSVKVRLNQEQTQKHGRRPL